jgi:hypothetical protein
MKQIILHVTAACLSLALLVRSTVVAAESMWPYAIPCRVDDGDNDDLFVMTLGDVNTELAQGTFDPVKDEVTLKDGARVENYYRERLGVEFYQPIDKSRFPLPPTGWCTWYYYYPRITATEAAANAKWIAENLKDYGAQFVQIDDGWQGSGGRDGGRDWTQIHPERFPDGMKELAETIKSYGLKPGIWLAPHGQSRRAVVDEHPKVFLLDNDGESLSSTWEGQFLVDPRPDESHEYLKDIFAKLADWGYVYYKIDGQPIVVGEYANKAGDSDHELYRKTLRTIRDAIGPDSYLLGCWGIPVEGMGIMNGSRTGGDIVRGWSRGFMLAVGATMNYYYQHNVAWYTDPDTMVLRSPLTVDQARAWATLQGLTGQALMGSDRLMDLGDERVEMLRRVYPAVDIRPLDLFPVRGRNKRVWDLKVAHLGRQYDVVGVFNYDESELEQHHLRWKDFGLPDDTPVHVYDFWNKEYLGAWEGGMAVDVQPTSVRVLTLLPDNGAVQLISTNRHITQGWVDLEQVDVGGDGMVFEGRSKAIKDDPYELTFAFPRGKGLAMKAATAQAERGGAGGDSLPVKVTDHQGWAVVRWTPAATGEIAWRVEFEPADFYRYPPEPVENLQVSARGLDGAELTWNELYWLNAGYRVYLNGESRGYAPRGTIQLDNLDPREEYTVDVATVWEDGSESRRKTQVRFTLASLLPTSMRLSEMATVRLEGGAGRGGFGGGNQMATIGGNRYNDWVAGPAVGYDLKGLFAKLTADVGVVEPGAGGGRRRGSGDGRQGDGSGASRPVTFVVEGDGKELSSTTVNPGDGLKPIDVDVAGVERIVLRTSVAGEQPRGAGRGGRRFGGFGPRGAWIDAKVTRETSDD